MKKIVFMGTPLFAKVILEMLIEEKYNVILVVSQPDKAYGRKKELKETETKKVALLNNIEVFQPTKLKTDYQKIIDLKPDLIITAAYGQMVPKELLNSVKSINIHGSLLPKYRGGAPIQYAIFNDEKKTGITIMDMAYKMDSGDIIVSEEVNILDSDNYTTLSDKLSTIGAKLLKKHLPVILDNKESRIKQDESLVSLAYTIKPIQELIDWDETTTNIHNKIRGLAETPLASTYINDTRIKILLSKKSDIIYNVENGTVVGINKKIIVATSDGSIEVLKLQQEGKKMLDVKDFLNGQSLIKVNDKFYKKEEKL